MEVSVYGFPERKNEYRPVAVSLQQKLTLIIPFLRHSLLLKTHQNGYLSWLCDRSNKAVGFYMFQIRFKNRNRRLGELQ